MFVHIWLNGHLGPSLDQSLHQVCIPPPGGEVHGGVPQGLLHVQHLLLRLAAQQLLAHVVDAGLNRTKQRDAAA